MSKSASPSHLGYLDSARGIAALMIFTYHYINWTYSNTLSVKYATILFNSEAVTFFFVLSGFVLSYKYIVLQHELDVRKFYIARIFRLWPAFFFTMIINSITWIDSFKTFKDIFLYNNYGFWDEALLIRGHPKFYIPSWTLSIELVMSFFIPFITAIALKNRQLIPWLCFAFVLMGAEFGPSYYFALGVLISCNFNWLQSGGLQQTKFYKYRSIVLLIAIVFFSLDKIHKISPLGPTYIHIADYLGISFGHYAAIASAIFIVAIIQSKRARTILEHSVFTFFGKISYGVYLMHWLVVSEAFHYWRPIRSFFPSEKVTFCCLFIACLAVTTFFALAVHYAIELPFIRLGKRLAQKVKPSVIVKP